MKTIAIDLRMIQSSGIGRYLQEIIPLITNDFKVIALGNPQELEKYDWSKNVKVIDFLEPIYSIKEQFQFGKVVPECDFFWSPHYNVPLFPIKAKKRICTIHDVFHLAFFNSLSLPQKIYAKLLINKAAKSSDLIFTVSEFSKREILKYTGTGKKIVAIHNGISKGFLDSFEEFNSENYFLFVGNVKPHKNLKNALLAFDKIADKYPEFKFKIVGKKGNFITNDDAVDEIASKRATQIEFTGFLSDEELRLVYLKAKAFVFPSLYEGFGIPPLEAQALGVPVLSSDIEVLKEVCDDSVCYFNALDVGDIAEKMEKILENDLLTKDLKIKGFKNISRFSWQKSAQIMIKEILGTV